MRSSGREKINAVSIPGFKGETSVYQNYCYYEQNRVFRTFVPNEIKIDCTCSGAHNWTNKLYFEHPEMDPVTNQIICLNNEGVSGASIVHNMIANNITKVITDDIKSLTGAVIIQN